MPETNDLVRDLVGLAPSWQKLLAEAASPAERDASATRLLRPYVDALSAETDPTLRRELSDALLSLHEIGPIGSHLLERLAEVADEHLDSELQRRVLELLAATGDPDVRLRAL